MRLCLTYIILPRVLAAFYGFCLLCQPFAVLFAAEPNSQCTPLRVGRDIKIKHSGSIKSAQFSPDGKKVVTASADGTAIIHDLASGQETKILHSGEVYSAQFSPDGKKVVTASADGTAIIHDLASGQETKILHSGGVYSAEISPDGNKVVTLTLSDDGTAIVHDLMTGQETKILHSRGVYSAQFSPDGKKVVTASNDGTAIVHDLKTAKESKIKHASMVTLARFSPDGKKVVTASADGTAIIHDLASGQETKILHSGEVYSAQFSPDGKKVVTASADGTAIIHDLAGGQETKILHSRGVYSAEISRDGKRVVTASAYGTVIIHDLASGQETTIMHSSVVHSAEFSPDSQKIVAVSTGGTAIVHDLRTQCAVLPGPPLDLNGTNPLCEQDTKKQGELDLAVILKLQNRCSKVMLLSEIDDVLQELSSAASAAHPGLVTQVLFQIFAASPNLYEDLMQKAPYLKQLLYQSLLKPESDLTAGCMIQKDSNYRNQVLSDYIDYHLVVPGRKTKIKDWDALKELLPFLKSYTGKNKSEQIEVIAQSLADSALDSAGFSAGFGSKIYYIAEHVVRRDLFGEKLPQPVTDITLLRRGRSITPVLLGIEPLAEKDLSNEWGFYARHLDGIDAGDLPQPGQPARQIVLNWTQGTHQFKGRILISKQHSKQIVPLGNSPAYKELWADQKLTGVIVVGSNMGPSLTSDVIEEYLKYFKEQGFEISDPPTPIASLPKKLEQLVSSGEADYLIKEAHSDGDEKNIFRMNVKASERIASRKNKDGTSEEVHLVYPDMNSSTNLISNQDFGGWIQDREKLGKGQFVYFNTSCWSKSKAVFEIEAASSSKFLNLASSTEVGVFRNDVSNGEFQLLTAFRESKDYDGIRAALEKNDDFKKGISNRFLFPGSDEFDEHIGSVIKVPITSKIEITGAGGKPYLFDAAIHGGGQ